MTLQIELEQETDGRWIGEVTSLPGVLAYGTTRTDALRAAGALMERMKSEMRGAISARNREPLNTPKWPTPSCR